MCLIGVQIVLREVRVHFCKPTEVICKTRTLIIRTERAPRKVNFVRPVADDRKFLRPGTKSRAWQRLEIMAVGVLVAQRNPPGEQLLPRVGSKL